MEWKWSQWIREYKEEWKNATKRTLFYHVFAVAVVVQIIYTIVSSS